MNLFQSSIDSIDHSDTILFSDRQKGLLEAINFTFQTAENIFCARHIDMNTCAKFSMKEIKNLFFQTVDSYSEQHFNNTLESINRVNPRACSYLREINLFISQSLQFHFQNLGIEHRMLRNHSMQ